MSAALMGFTDGSGNVLTGQEEDDSFETSLATQLAPYAEPLLEPAVAESYYPEPAPAGPAISPERGGAVFEDELPPPIYYDEGALNPTPSASEYFYGDLFVPDVQLDPSQVEDHRGRSVGTGGGAVD